MAQKKVLIQLPNGSIRPFSERAAKIAVENLGGEVVDPSVAPPELNTRIKIPPQITQPIPLKKVEVIRPPELGTKTIPVEVIKTEIKQENIAEKFDVPVTKVKQTRKARRK